MLDLLCFPYAGGNAGVFRGLAPHLRGARVCPVDLPGHGSRIAEPPLTSLEALAEDLLPRLGLGPAAAPYALFGHSLGATLAFVLTRRILRAGLPPPLALFVSGRQAPSVPDAPLRHTLPPAEFRAMLASLGGCPPEVLANEELIRFFEPALRADFQAAETWTYTREPPFAIPITVLLGTRDIVSESAAAPWQHETTRPIEILRLEGGHFFLLDHWPEVGRILSSRLARQRSDSAR